MTHPVPPDLARFSALLAPPRRHRLAVCLRNTTALAPPLSVLAAMLVSLVQGIFTQAPFPEAVLARPRRWSFPSGAAADPAPCGEATPHVQRSAAGEGSINASLRPTPPPNLGPLRGPSPQGEGEYFGLAAAYPDAYAATPRAQRRTPVPAASPTKLRTCDAKLPAGAPARQHPMPSGSRGRLKNGAPGGDYLAAPRCGARTRAGGSCRQPGMPNGRCRLHGGKSTGARTEAGRERLRSIHTRHGGYGRDALAWFRRMDAFIAETKQFMAESRRTSAVAAAVPPAAGCPSGQSFPRAGRSQPTPGGASSA